MKRWLSDGLPDQKLLDGRLLRPFAHRLRHPSLWHFNRWSVSSGLALGLFCGFLLPMGQIALAAFFALSLRANLAVAASATLVTNPFTFPAIYFAAYKVGTRVTSGGPGVEDEAGAAAWFVSVSLPTALGLALFAIVSAALGYVAVHFAWRVWVARRWTRRRAAA